MSGQAMARTYIGKLMVRLWISPDTGSYSIRIRTRIKYGLKQTWYSICSKHRGYVQDCYLCNAGSWKYDWKHAISSYIFKKFPNLWRWWVNLTW